MLFNSAEFLVFFPIVVGIYFLTPHRWRWVLLLAASYYFYMSWKAEYIFLILLSTGIDYWAGLQMGKRAERTARRPFLILSLCSNLGILFAFKYFNFFNDSTRALFDGLNIFYDVPAFNVLLPVGISFYTFQTLSYSIDVFRGRQEPERHLGIFALYVAFFPQLVAGPIERSLNLLPQFRQKVAFDYERVTSGLRLMAWGFFKKVVIADKLALLVDGVYGDPQAHTGLTLIFATYFFAYQIYCDFSGYSDIAIGAARVLGIDLMKNFRQPYLSQSIPEFWRRWHISLSTWFRDYLYIPLGGNRVSQTRLFVNVMIVFLVSGLWHGANWTFVIWGGLHGLFLIASLITQPLQKQFMQAIASPKIVTFIRWLVTFNLATFAWIFFRANTLSDAWYIATHLFTEISLSAFVAQGFSSELGRLSVGLLLLAIVALELVEYLHRTRRFVLPQQRFAVRWSGYYLLVMTILFWGQLESDALFIYFQF